MEQGQENNNENKNGLTAQAERLLGKFQQALVTAILLFVLLLTIGVFALMLKFIFRWAF